MTSRVAHLTAPVSALLQGLYEQETSVGELKALGDHGLGTFNDLDGEMVMTRGRVFQMDASGAAREVDDAVRTPFACVAPFDAQGGPDSVEEIEAAPGRDDLLALLPRLIPADNMLYALRVEGSFRRVLCRSVPRQDNYRPLVEVTRDQTEFEFSHVRGVLAGFHAPAFLKSLTVPGIHLHFLSQEHNRGGHLLAAAFSRITVAVKHLPRLCLTLPMQLDYLTTELDRDAGRDLDEAERAKADRASR